MGEIRTHNLLALEADAMSLHHVFKGSFDNIFRQKFVVFFIPLLPYVDMVIGFLHLSKFEIVLILQQSDHFYV
jgi:hypothetical protein